MSSNSITRSQARTLVLARLREIQQSVPVSERGIPRLFIDNRPFSINAEIREVALNTEIGKRIINSHATNLGYIITD